MLKISKGQCVKVFFAILCCSACGKGISHTVTNTSVPEPSAPGTGVPEGRQPNGRESWAWLPDNWQASLQAIAGHPEAFTHVSPVFYSLNYDYTSGVAYYFNCPGSPTACTSPGTNDFEGLTTAEITAKLTKLGIATIPGIFAGASNHGVDSGVQNVLNNTHGEAENFIASMVQEAVTNGYSGYNIDWETGAGIGSADTDHFISFINAFKQALAAHGMSLSVDVIVSNIGGTYCSNNDGYLDFNKLSASDVDRIVVEDYTKTFGTSYTTCQPIILSSSDPVQCPLNGDGSDVTATGVMNLACANLDPNKVVIGVDSNSGATNPIAGQVFSALSSYGINKVAVWPSHEAPDPYLSAQGLVADKDDWYSLLTDFLNL